MIYVSWNGDLGGCGAARTSSTAQTDRTGRGVRRRPVKTGRRLIEWWTAAATPTVSVHVAASATAKTAATLITATERSSVVERIAIATTECVTIWTRSKTLMTVRDRPS